MRQTSIPTKAGKRDCSRIDAHVGTQIRRRRIIAKITQEVVGKVLGISFQQVQKYENGTNRISAGRLFLIASLLGVKVDDFFDGIETRSNDDRGVDDALRQVEKFSATREGASLCIAYLNAPHARSRKLAVAVLRLGAESKDIDGE